MKVVFNTGRLYQPDGQIITATYDPETGVVLFMDHSRGIAGELNAGYPVPADLARFVMREYDAGRYRMSMDAMQLTRDPNIEPRRIRL